MSIRIQSGFFDSMADVLDDVKVNGTWPTTFVSGKSDGLPVHWHADEVHVYVMEGETDFLDVAADRRLPVKAGDKVVIPAGTLHAEGAVLDRVVYVIGLPGPRAADEFLAMRAPDEQPA